MSTIQLLFGRHGARDHYLGGRYVRSGRARPQRLAFPLSERTVHLFELITPSQLREPVPARRIFPVFATRYDLTALMFAQQVEKSGDGASTPSRGPPPGKTGSTRSSRKPP